MHLFGHLAHNVLVVVLLSTGELHKQFSLSQMVPAEHSLHSHNPSSGLVKLYAFGLQKACGLEQSLQEEAGNDDEHCKAAACDASASTINGERMSGIT